MKFHVLSMPRSPIPPEQLSGLAERASEWQEQYRDNIETLGVFPGGGGFAILDVPDEAHLQRLILEMPLTPFADTETQPFVDGRKGYKQLKQAAERRLVAVHT